MDSKDHSRAYLDLTEQLLARIDTVQSRDSARRFARESAKLVRKYERQVPEFYKHEFLELFKKQFLQRATEGVDAAQGTIDDAKMGAQISEAELTARLVAASAADDQAAQHQVWKEREERQADVNNEYSNARDLVQLFDHRLDAFYRLAAALGVTFS